MAKSRPAAPTSTTNERNKLEEEEVVEHQRARFQEPTILTVSLTVECQECKLSEIIFIVLKAGLYFPSPFFKGDWLKLLMEMLASEERVEMPDKGFPCAQVPEPVAWDSTSTSSPWAHPGGLLKSPSGERDQSLRHSWRKMHTRAYGRLLKWRMTAEEIVHASLYVAAVICRFVDPSG